MLLKVMKEPNATADPVFMCNALGDSGFQVCMELYVSGTTYTVGPLVHVSNIVGDTCSSPQLAEFSAIKNAFVYLDCKHNVLVRDYRSRLIQKYKNKRARVEVNSATDALQKVLDEWYLATHECQRFQSELEKKVMWDNGQGMFVQNGRAMRQSIRSTWWKPKQKTRRS